MRPIGFSKPTRSKLCMFRHQVTLNLYDLILFDVLIIIFRQHTIYGMNDWWRCGSLYHTLSSFLECQSCASWVQPGRDTNRPGRNRQWKQYWQLEQIFKRIWDGLKLLNVRNQIAVTDFEAFRTRFICENENNYLEHFPGGFVAAKPIHKYFNCTIANHRSIHYVLHRYHRCLQGPAPKARLHFSSIPSMQYGTDIYIPTLQPPENRRWNRIPLSS